MLTQSQRHVFGEIRHDQVGPRPLDREQRLVSRRHQLEPAALGRRVDLRIFARNLIGRDGLFRHPTHVADDIQIKTCRFHHQDIRTLGVIEFELAERLAAVRRIHLVGRFVQRCRPRRSCTADRFAKRSIISRGKLHRISHDPSLLKPRRIQRAPDRTNPSVHHITRRHQIDPRPRMKHRHLAEDIHRPVIRHLATVFG